jgi:hypothetical protein
MSNEPELGEEEPTEISVVVTLTTTSKTPNDLLYESLFGPQ